MIKVIQAAFSYFSIQRHNMLLIYSKYTGKYFNCHKMFEFLYIYSKQYVKFSAESFIKDFKMQKLKRCEFFKRRDTSSKVLISQNHPNLQNLQALKRDLYPISEINLNF